MAYAVPNVPGVPQILGGFAPSAALSILPSNFLGLGSTTLSFLPISVGQQWGIFLGGAPVVVAESVISIDYKQDWVIADFPIEGGKFESYDKVWRPFDVRFRFSAGGNESARQALLDSVAAIAGDLNLYDFVSPEAIYENVSVAHYDYHRTATNGVGLLVVDVWGWQIMLTTSSALTNTASPASADPSAVGPAQPGTPTSNQIGLAQDPRHENLVRP